MATIMRRSPGFRLLGVLVTALALAAGTAHAQRSSEIIASQSTDILTLDPSVDSSAIGINVFLNIFDQLTGIGPDGSVLPLIATRWDVTPDARTWTFTIRRNARFHNGQPVTVDDVKWTYEKIMADAKSPNRAYLTQIDRIEKLNDDQIRFTLKAPFAIFNRQVSLISILPRKAYEEMGAQRFATQAIGSGPFKVVKWTKDAAVELEANPDYWGGAPKFPKLTFKPVPDASARSAGLLSGALDVVPALPPPLIDSLSSRPGVRIERVASNRVIYVGFNPNVPPMNNLKVRQAIDHAIDRETMTAKLLRGLGKPIGQIPSPVTFGYDPTIEPTKYDPALARQLLKEAGYKGEKIVFQFPTNRFAFGTEVAQAVAGYMSQAGINVELQGMEFAAMFPLWAGNKLGAMYMFSLGISILDSDLVLNLQYESGVSHGYWHDPEVDRLAKLQRGEVDADKRKKIYSQIWRMSKDNAAYAVLYNEIQAYGVRDRVKWTPRPDERLSFKDAEIVSK
jgi:peptide/nickel transport system substrate-binding protein